MFFVVLFVFSALLIRNFGQLSYKKTYPGTASMYCLLQSSLWECVCLFLSDHSTHPLSGRKCSHSQSILLLLLYVVCIETDCRSIPFAGMLLSILSKLEWVGLQAIKEVWPFACCSTLLASALSVPILLLVNHKWRRGTMTTMRSHVDSASPW